MSDSRFGANACDDPVSYGATPHGLAETPVLPGRFADGGKDTASRQPGSREALVVVIAEAS